MEVYKFRLFIAGGTPNSAQALSNLIALCESRLAGRHDIEVIDVFHEPLRALKESIFMTPTLLKLSPAPELRIVGTLADSRRLLQALGLEGMPA